MSHRGVCDAFFLGSESTLPVGNCFDLHASLSGSGNFGEHRNLLGYSRLFGSTVFPLRKSEILKCSSLLVRKHACAHGGVLYSVVRKYIQTLFEKGYIKSVGSAL